MGKCANHPERETVYQCGKYGRYLCGECLSCSDPKLYCKFRSACAIWFLGKGAGNLDEDGSPENNGAKE